MDQIIQITCINCGEEIQSSILNLTGENVFDVDMMLDYESFDCNKCGTRTGISIMKEEI